MDKVGMSASQKETLAGQAAYTRWTLPLYDFLVLRVSCRLIWNCPAQRLEQHYQQHVTANHLDVGVGTGYFLDHCRFPSQTPRLALMDLSPTALAFAARRVARYRPDTYFRNILEPIEFSADRFDSISLSYVLHCLPGNLETKAAALDHLARLMNPGAVLFGATLLQGGVRPGWGARRLMAIYNRKGIFSNREDTLDSLALSMNQRFRDVTIEVAGCCALFSGRL
jgi:ubiquinone/menaquinone biosynthesis C-methylase UbiE